MKLKIAHLYVALAALTFGCKPDIKEDITATSGTANFSQYVAVGNSLTAGYADGALYKQGQSYAYPNILAQQFALVGGGPFKIPYMVDDNGIGVQNNQPVTKRILGPVTDCKGVTSLGPVFAGIPNLANLAPIPGPFNNMGVPGAKSFHLLTPLFGRPLTQGGNPFYYRMASNPGVSTVVGDVVAQNPTFVSIWIGNNDVLGYASTGGEEGGDSITSVTAYTQYLYAIVNTVTAGGAKGVIANITDVTSIPYFRTVPYNGLVLTSQAQVDALNAGYAPLGIKFNLGQNPFIISDKNAPGGLRQIKSDELILLTIPQDSIKCKGLGSQIPIPGKYVLDQTEIANIKTATAGYNQAIVTVAQQKDLAFADMASLMSSLSTGITFDGLTFTTTFVTGGAFSLDGIHLTPQGNAIVANGFIDAINHKYSSTLPQVNVASYPGIVFP
ncbi:MAG: hypothetical protein J7604_23695 [Sporocytophaga sp.]|uniref:SGNH/GDSL hydrolase family protein n=1 Tax=Sporocytophaga sp. TaxID=2231183 RepID=UPI001B0187E0|nr:SGNH/GDSL hydrolase family protein [Sporocytophaga sp.]MBO9703239.1 hypothetical protein [Sporocytophaga sp.]